MSNLIGTIQGHTTPVTRKGYKAMKSFKVFKRAWWRIENGRLVPHPGARKTTLRTGLTESEARQFCREYNEANPPCAYRCAKGN